MASALVDANLIGLSLNQAVTTTTGSSESLTLTGDWSISALSSMDLVYDAVVSALSQAVSNKSVLSLVFVVDWAE